MSASVGERAGPLEGLRVLELGMLIAGPFAGRLIADLGAEVIKVEAPDRLDPMREWGQGEYDGRSLWWPIMSRGKKCVTLNLRVEEGQRLLLELAARSDALIENFRPGTLERWNLSYERLRKVNPKLVLVRVSGYGQTGPYAPRAGFAAAAEAIGGLRYINGFPGEVPPRTGISLGDSLAAMFAVQGLLTALYRRDALQGDSGQVVDVSILESCFALMESAAPEYDRLGSVREPTGSRMGGIAPSNAFRSSDGKVVVIAANQDSVFARLCQAMDRNDLLEDERYRSHRGRFEHQDELEAHISRWAAQRSAQEIERELSQAGVVCGPVNSIADIFADPHVRARDMLIDHEDSELGRLVGPGVLPKFSSDPGRVRWSGPWTPGAHNHDVYGGMLGISDAELSTLSERGHLVKIELVEVGPRDGLQNAPGVFEPEMRAALARRLTECGLRRMEVVSFVDPRRVPQMAHAEEVVARLPIHPEAGYTGLILNTRGYERLRTTQLQDVRFTLAASEAFNRANSNATTAELCEQTVGVLKRAAVDGCRVGVVIATTFGCPFTGEVPVTDALEIAERLAGEGASEIVFADTIGVAVPRQIREMLRAAAGFNVPLGVHLHNTRNTGYVNAFAAIEAGATVLDASVGGLGGCPFAPGATGNIATEDLVYMLEREGVATAIDQDRLIATAQWLHQTTQLPLPGQVHSVAPFPPAAESGSS